MSLPENKSFLASHMYIDAEPFQRTDIGMQPLGPILLDVLNCGFLTKVKDKKARFQL